MTIAGTHNHLVTGPELDTGEGILVVVTRWGDRYYAMVSDTPHNVEQSIEYDRSEVLDYAISRIAASPSHVEFRVHTRSFVGAHATTFDEALAKALEGLREGRRRGELL